MGREPWRLSAAELTRQVRAGERSAVDVVEATLSRIEARNARTNAFVTVCASEAREAARELDRAREAGEPLGPLHGVPLALKDLEGLKAGVRHTFGSVPFADWVPDVTVAIVERLEAAGAIVVGKTNTPEFGHLGATDNRLFGPTSTPFDVDRNAGGSSGGSAAAVADGLVPIAQGSDTGGSIRVPAAFCGVVGLKPSFGRVPSSTRPDGFGHAVPMSSSGPLARTVEDAALALAAMQGPHASDPLSLPDDGLDPLAAGQRPIDGWTVGYSEDLDVFAVEDEVRAVVEDAVKALGDAGAHVEPVELGFERTHGELFEVLQAGAGTYFAAMSAHMGPEGSDLVAEHGDALTRTFRSVVERGRAVSAVELRGADVARTEVYERVEATFEQVDALVAPTTGIVGFENADEPGTTLGPREVDGEPVDPSIGWALTFPFNLTGHPAASVPAGQTSEGLPVGLQVVGPRLRDDVVLAVAGALERQRGWADAYPGT